MDELEGMGCAGQNSAEGADDSACKAFPEKFASDEK